MKTGIVGILNNTATSVNSHSAGWNYVIRDSINSNAEFLTEKDNWLEYDALIICHGPNYKEGSYNIAGGIQPETIERSKKLNDFKGKIYSVDNFDPNDFYEKRKLDLKFNGVIEKLSLPTKNKIAYGDSHIISVWPDNDYEISRNDGKTLFGFLRDPKNFDNYEDIILYFGNIDIRFHLCRQANPLKATAELVERYVEFAKKCNATITNLLPVESETRKIPGTGKYKGENFFGTQEQRNTLVLIANDIMNSSGLNTIQWPEEWYEDLDYFEKQVMEPRQSVHLRPKFYHKNIKEKEQMSIF
jgi:hypothetical protein|tara:strand:+ start:235 stop:1137 length:903 start_codon:yes stop_codon:yes gene_type:complete